LSNQNINLPGNSNEPLCFKITEEDRSKESSDTEIIVDLQAIPNSEIVQSFRVEGIRFQLCVPFPTFSSIIDNKDSENNASSNNLNVVGNEESKLLSVHGFIPIKLRGPRLAMTKEQAIMKAQFLLKIYIFSVEQSSMLQTKDLSFSFNLLPHRFWHSISLTRINI